MGFCYVFACTLICLELSPGKVGCLSREPEGLLSLFCYKNMPPCSGCGLSLFECGF